MKSLLLALLVTFGVCGCKSEEIKTSSHITFTCLELTEDQKASIDKNGAIPKGSFISNKNTNDCNKVGGIIIKDFKEE